MTLRLIYITIVSVALLLTLVVFRITTTHTTVTHTTIREIHHYPIHSVAEAIAREILYEHMREVLHEQMWIVLYGYKRDEPIFPENIYFWWAESPYSLFNIFPGGFINYYYGNQDP